jgi:hypothetical protein
VLSLIGLQFFDVDKPFRFVRHLDPCVVVLNFNDGCWAYPMGRYFVVAAQEVVVPD